MAKIFELFGHSLDASSDDIEQQRRSATCPFTSSRCDGGGNRHQTTIQLSDSPGLRDYFDDSIDQVVPGVCSLEYSKEQWVVCPRRLMGFNSPEDVPELNKGLQTHEIDSLRGGGLPQGVELGVWPEVHLSYSIDDSDIQYRFDFVIAQLFHNVTLGELFDYYNVTDESEKDDLINSARRGDWLFGRVDRETQMKVAPKLDSPFIVEVMTASTSGSNRRKRTDIASAFEDAILSDNHEGPGINKRQVWGRMATQLFAKSALAEAWGGQALWFVQGELIHAIESTTQLSISESDTAEESTVNFVWLDYKNQAGNSAPKLEFGGTKRVKSGIDFKGDQTCADILIPAVVPPKQELLKAVLRSEISGRIQL